MKTSYDLSQIDVVFYAVKEAATILKEFNDKTFSVLYLNVRSLNQNFECLKDFLQTTIKFKVKVTNLTETWCVGDSRNKTFNLVNYTSIKLGNMAEGAVYAPLFTILLTFKVALLK